MKRTLIGLVLAAVVAACGSRGGPLPPIDRTPPPFPDARVLQRGDRLLVQFGTLPEVVNVNGALVTLRDVEVLLLAERYPAITPDVLALALDEERAVRLRAARRAAASAREEVERRRELAEAAAAAEAAAEQGEEAAAEAEPEPEPEEEEEEERALTADELAIRGVPRAVLAEWRAAEVTPDALLDAAYRLQNAVDTLWEELDMPAAIVDLREPPRLPDPGEVILGARRVERTLTYEDEPDIEVFLREAEVVATIPFSGLEQYRTADQLEYAYTIPAPEVSNVRARYIFAVRAVSESGDEGQVGRLLPLAPALVPAAPATLTTEILPTGIRLAWEAPTTDIGGNPLGAADIRYNVYRRELPEQLMGQTPRNPLPLVEPEWIDTDTDWQERYFYEIRASTATLADLAREEERQNALVPPAVVPVTTEAPATIVIRKESAPLASAEIFTEDTFPPLKVTNLQVVRAGSRVTLRWNASGSSDLAGYRIYRHPAPAPETEGLEIVNLPASAVAPAAAAAAADATDPGAEQGVVAEAQLTPEQERAAARERRRQRQRNALVDAGWELLTAVVTTQTRYIDPSADPTITWIYVVEAVDESQNVSTPVGVVLEAENQP